MAIDFTTDIGKIRALTGDVIETLPDNTNGLFMSDAELNAILGLDGGVIQLAAATALETMATKHAMIVQKIRTLDLQTDGPAVANALLDRAKTLRETYRQQLDDEGSSFEIIEMIFNGRQAVDYMRKQWMREGF